MRRWESAADQPPIQDNANSAGVEDMFRHGASPFRTSQEAPPKFGWEHAWGLVKWGRKAGAWGKGVEGLGERQKDETKKDRQ